MREIDDLPDEILEYIFHTLPPYEDLISCSAVSKKWQSLARPILARIKNAFIKSLSTMDVTWNCRPTDISKRYSHAACRWDNAMYVFGGFVSSFSSYNDLLRFDLSTRTWRRLVTNGHCPTPRAGATLVAYENKLYLYGGLTPPSNRFLNRTRELSNELFVYDIATNVWTEKSNWPPAPIFRAPQLAGHSATIHNGKMVIFGGVHMVNCTDRLFELDLKKLHWNYIREWTEPKPAPRCSHSQIRLDERYALVIGGICTNDAFLNTIYEDVWLLDTKSYVWQKIVVPNSAILRTVWTHPVCKVDDYMVVLKPSVGNPGSYANWFPVDDPSSCLPQSDIVESASRSAMRRLAAIMNQSNTPPVQLPTLELHLFHLGEVSADHRLTYVRGDAKPRNSPTDTIMYTLVEGNGELFLFGGLKKLVTNGPQSADDGTQVVLSNDLHVLRSTKSTHWLH